MSTANLVIFIFAGRRANMEIQMPYLDRILETYPDAVLHLWDLTRDPADARYLDTLEGAHGGRVAVLRHLHGGHPIKCFYPHSARRPRGHPRCTCLRHKPPYEEPYKWYAAHPHYSNCTFVKMDDDVLFLETDNFDMLIEPLSEFPNRIISANVINNAVCAKYNTAWRATANTFAVGDPSLPKNDQRWWALHTDPEFAAFSHEGFLRCMGAGLNMAGGSAYIRTRPGEAVSINCIAFTHTTMKRLAGMMSDTLGDEGAVDRCLPWIAREFIAAHLTFGPQDAVLEKTGLLERYRNDYWQLSKEYLG